MHHIFVKILLVSVLLVVPYVSVIGQDWETGMLLGGSNYTGDFAPYPVPEETHFAGGFFVQRNLSRYISLDLSFNYASISGNDQNFDHFTERNLHFQTDIYELSLQAEYNFFPFALGVRTHQHTPFFFTGLSVFYFEPQAQYEGEWIDLRPLRTEGQGLEDGPGRYSPVNLSLPIGMGYRFDMGPRWIIGFKTGFRASFTDYLDDVSGTYYDAEELAEIDERSPVMANPGTNDNYLGTHGKRRGSQEVTDWYVFAQVVISFRIRNPVCYKF